MQQTYAQNPLALVLASFNSPAFHSWVAAHPESLAAPNVAVIKGPLLETPIARPPSPLGGLGGFRVGVLGVACMSLLTAVGLGWAILLLGRWLAPLHVLAVSPAVGIAALVLGGVAVDRVGIRLTGAGGVLPLVLMAASSWGILAVRRLRAPS
jgi:hypothetical protein